MDYEMTFLKEPFTEQLDVIDGFCKQCKTKPKIVCSNFCSQECCDEYLGLLIAQGIQMGIVMPRIKEDDSKRVD